MVRMRKTNLSYIIFFVALTFLSTAIAQTSPQGISLQGRIMDSGDNPLEDLSVLFTVQVLSPGAEECVLYEETHTVNMTGSGGVFALPLGAGTRSGAAFEDTSTLAQVFNNASAQINALTCASGNSFTPGTGNKRKVKMTFDVGGGPQVVTQMLDIQAVPYALYADTLQGKGITDFLQTSAMTTQVKIDNLAITANYNELLALIAGTSANYTLANGTNFTPAADVDFNGKKIVDLAAPTAATDAVNKNYSDTKFGGANLDQTGLANDQSIRWNAGASKWEVYTPSTNDATKLPLAGGTMTGAIDMGGNNLLATGHITMSPQKTLNFGTYTDAQETALVGSLALVDKGKVWYNSDHNQIKMWVGSAPAVVILSGNEIGTAVGKVMGADAVPNCLATEKLQMSAGPTYSWSCVTDAAGPWSLNTTHAFYNGGNVGIGTNTPAAKFDVAGDIKIGDSSATCNGTTEGSQRYNTTSNKMEYCNGTAWADIDTTSSGTVTSVTASAPLASSGGATPNITVSDATTGAKGVVQVGAGLNVSSGTISVNAGTGNNQIVQLDGSSKLPAVDGSALTNVVATNVSGTVAVANGGTGATTAANARTNLGLVIGTDVQGYDAQLTDVAGLSPTADNFIAGNGSNFVLKTPTQARTSLGLGTAAVLNTGTGATDLASNSAVPNCLPNQKLEMSAGPVYTWSCVTDTCGVHAISSALVWRV